MTPKEKAKDLVEKFRNEIISFLNDNMKDQNAKRCALIAVNEVISVINPETNFKTWEFYKQVKKEIEKL